jgi:tankyrase
LKGADAFEKDQQKAPIHLACENAFLDCIDILLFKPSSSSSHSRLKGSLSLAVDSNGETPLHIAARGNNMEICERLILHSYDLNAKSNLDKYPHELCTDLRLRKYLFEKFESKCKLNDLNLDVQLLLEASKSGDLEVVKRILSKNRDLVNCFDKDGRLSTPLHFASGYNRLNICQYLIEMNADVLACDKGLLQPIHNSSSYGFYRF